MCVWGIERELGKSGFTDSSLNQDVSLQPFMGLQKKLYKILLYIYFIYTRMLYILKYFFNYIYLIS